jgi:hypothetical protein
MAVVGLWSFPEKRTGRVWVIWMKFGSDCPFFSYWPSLVMISLIIGMKFVALFLLSVHVLTKLLFGPQIRIRYWLIWRYGMFFLWYSTLISIIQMGVIIDYWLKRLVIKNWKL